MKTTEYCAYLEQYCSQFALWEHIKLSTLVKHVHQRDGTGHVVYYVTEGSAGLEDWKCDAVAVCSGLHVTPNLPVIPGTKHVPTVMHSSNFKERKQFGINQDILILGSGETAMDLGYLAVTSLTKSVTLCHRDGWQNTPKVCILSSNDIASADRYLLH